MADAIPLAAASPPVATNRISRTTRVWGGLIGCMGSFLLGIVVLGGVAGAFAVNLYREPPVTSDTTQTLDVTGPQHLVVHGSAGDVQINAGSDNAMTVEVKKSARAISQSVARQLLDAMHVSITQSGNVVTVQEQDANFITFFSEQQVNLIITAPAQTNLTDSLSAGNLTVIGFTGQLNLDNSAGNISLHDVTINGVSRIHESAGNIDLTGQMATGASLDVQESAGNISFTASLATNNRLTFGNSAGDINLHLPQATDAQIKAQSSAGNITIHGWPIDVSQEFAAASASGNTSSDPNPSNTITISESAGNISIAAQG